MLDDIWKIIRWIWNQGHYAAAAVVAILVVLALAEGAQSHLFGESAFRMAARVVPWNPILQHRAGLDAVFNLKLPNTESVEDLKKGAECPVGSEITFEYSRSRSGWVSTFGLTEPFSNKKFLPYSLSRNGLDAVPVEGGTKYYGKMDIKSADGYELLVIVGAYKPFDPRKEIIPSLRRLGDSKIKGGEATLDGFDVAWSDTPRFTTCRSM